MTDQFHMFDRAEGPAKIKTLRAHQVDCLSLVRASLQSGNKRTVCQMPTGAGKTLTAAKIIESALAKGNRVIFTAPAISLIDQTVAAFEAEGIRDIGVMQASHPRTNPAAMVQVASVQTLAKRDIPQAALVIVDEAHISAIAVDKLMAERPDVYFIGLSATPWAKGMGLKWDDLVTPCTIGDLINAGYLSKFTAYAPTVPNLAGVKITAGEYAEAALMEVMGNAPLMAGIVQTWLEKGENRPTLLFAINCLHAQALQAEFMQAGVSAGYVDAFTDLVERRRIERLFRSGEIKVACSVRTLTTGIDWPVSCIVDAAPTRSEMLHVQKIGRGLRVNPGTEDCLILDHAGNSLRLGLVTDIHHATLDKTPKGEKQPRVVAEKLPTECSACSTLFAGKVCPFCGHERKPVVSFETADGELTQIGGKVAVASRATKQEWWSGILSIQRSRGKSAGWAAHAYKDKFGVWPRGLDDTATNPTPEVANFIKAKAIRYAKAQEAKRGAA